MHLSTGALASLVKFNKSLSMTIPICSHLPEVDIPRSRMRTAFQLGQCLEVNINYHFRALEKCR